MIFINGKGYKLDQVQFQIPKNKKGKDDYLSPWKITSNDNSVDFEFIPTLDRHANTNALIIQSNQHQVFGKFTGYIIADNKKVEFKDMLGFAEKVRNCW